MMVGRGHMSSIQRFCSCPNVFKFETYLNIDGFIRLEDGSATTGDHSRQWILGYNRFLRSCLLVETELWGILDGLNILIARGYTKVHIRTNGIEVASVIQEIASNEFTTSLMRKILQLLSQTQYLIICHIPKEENQEADILTKLAHINKRGLQIFEIFPLGGLNCVM